MADDKQGWVGFDLDGTLAEYTEWQGPSHIGKPIIPMVEKVKTLIAQGTKVKIMTARAYPQGRNTTIALDAIRSWCRIYIGTELEITYMKDYNMLELYDDRCIQIIPNTGKRADGKEL
jgi:hypothetical protein